jgi:hypothetical protein
MSKNYKNNNQYYGNREQRRQQERKNRDNAVNSIIDINKYIRHDNIIETSIPQEDDELICKIQYRGEEYEISTGYISILTLSAFQSNSETMNPIEFDKILRVLFMEGEYERFFKNNPRISVAELRNVLEAMIKFVAIDKSKIIDNGGSEEQDSFRN